jgi:hypothetical protein
VDPISDRLRRIDTDLRDAQSEVVDVADEMRDLATKIRDGEWFNNSFDFSAKLEQLADRLAPTMKETSKTVSDVPF